MNEILKELITEILLLGEAGESKKYPGYYKMPGFGLYADKPNATAATHRVDRATKQLVPIGQTDEPQGKQPADTGTAAAAERPAQQAPAGTATPKMSRGFKNQEIYDEFNSVMASGNPDQIRAFIEKYGVIFAPDKNTFYITLDGNGNKIEGDARKIFGDGKTKRAGQAQKELHDKLKAMGVEVKTVETSSSKFAPSRVAPQSSRTTFDRVATRNEDGSITVTDDTGRAITYESIPNDDYEAWADEKLQEWLSSPEGQEASKNTDTFEETKRKMREQLVLTSFSISQRNSALRKLLEGSGPVAIYDTPERQEEYVGNLESTVTSSIPDGPRKERITAKFKQYREAKTPEEAAEILADIIDELVEEAKSNQEFRRSGSIPDIAEGFSSLVEMKRGRLVIVPLQGNFPVSDVISLDTRETRNLSASELVGRVKLIYVGVSVKFGRGGSSSMIDKVGLSVFRDHRQTTDTLRLLATKSSQQGSIFDPDESRRTARRQEVRATIEPHVQEVSDYYGFNPPAENVDQLIEWLGRGEPECVDDVDDEGKPIRKVVPRRNPPPPVGKGKKSEAGKDPSGEAVDVEGWAYTWAAQAVYAAIYNGRVIGQAFASQTWQPNGIPPLVEADGTTGLTKQIPQPLKQAKDSSRGMTYQPDTLVAFMKPTTSEAELRSGNPCK